MTVKIDKSFEKDTDAIMNPKLMLKLQLVLNK
jgi:hypothetical protein